MLAGLSRLLRQTSQAERGGRPAGLQVQLVDRTPVQQAVEPGHNSQT